MGIRVDKAEVRRMRAGGATLQTIADRFQVSRAAISLSLSRVTCRENQPREKKACACGCGQGTIRKFATRGCYFGAVVTGNYRPSRAGQKRARTVVSSLMALEPEQVVHHVDGDNRNNARENLWVFASQREHLSFHRGGVGRPVWRGAETKK